MNFTIKTLWNSTLIIRDRLVKLSLSSTDDKDNLLIKIDAPFFNDPAPSLSPPDDKDNLLIEIDNPFLNDPARSLLPPGPFAELWNYEVVELFFLASSTNHCIELEFSPHGHYFVLLLIDRRKILKQLLPLPKYHVEQPSSGRWIGEAYVPRIHFPAHVDRFNAYAIHGQEESRTYEALYPAPPQSEKPDFHHLELFQPLNFEFLLNVTDKDGDSWNNHASLSASFSSFLLKILLVASFSRKL